MSTFLPRSIASWLLLLALLFPLTPAAARIGLDQQALLGNPDGAVTQATSRTKYLIKRAQFNLSYNDDTHQANWVSWSITTNGLGTVGRTDAWAVEELLPTGYLRIGTTTFGSSVINGATTSWDRGHMAPSADRTQSLTDNQATFRMSNIIPQASANNQGLWANFENYCRSLANNNNEVLIISGPSEFTGNRIGNSMSVPGSVWKIAVVLPNASSNTPAVQRVSTSSRVIALLTPNVSSGLGTWQSYLTSVEQIEEVTGLNFFTSVDPSTAIYLKNVVDSGTGPDNPTVITTFNPTLGAPGSTSVNISGYNFGSSSTVQFNGVEAAVIYNNPNQLTATVPAGATTGLITVTGPGATDTSYENFTVTAGPIASAITVSPASLPALSATEGFAGTAQIYALNGSSLTAPVVVTAPTHFEISADGVTYESSTIITPDIDGSLGVQVSVRIKSTAPAGAVSGSINHTTTGATMKSVSVSGSVASNAPHIVVSAASLTGFTALEGRSGMSKSYAVSGGNLAGSITITAPSGFEVSFNDTAFAGSLALAPSAGAIATTMVYARLRADAPLGTNTGSITHSGGGANPENIALSGSVITPGGGTPGRIAAWDFTGESNVATSVAEIFSDGLDANNTLTRGSTAAASAGNNSFRTTGFQNNGISTTNTDYFQMSFSSAAGTLLSMNSITARFAGTSSYFASPGVSNQFAYSTNGTNFVLLGSPVVLTGTSSPATFDVSAVAELQNLPDSVTVTFRYYASGQTTTGGWGFTSPSAGSYGLDVTGIISSTAQQPSPVITVAGAESATALQAYSYQIVANNLPTSYAATGLPDGLAFNRTTGLISGTPTAPGTYTVGLLASNGAGDGTATLTLTVARNPNAPSITSNLIIQGQIGSALSYQITALNTPTSFTAANLPAGLTINTSTGLISGIPTNGGIVNATITALNDFGSDSKTLQTTVLSPTLTVNPATLNPLTANAGSFGVAQSYILTGSELTSGITVHAPQHFEISTGGNSFSGEITLTPAAHGSLSQTISVRLADTAPPGIASGAISHTGSGAGPKYIDLTGTVSTTNPSLTVSKNSLDPFSTAVGLNSASQTYEVSGASLTGPVTITAPDGFEVGPDPETLGASVILTPVNGALAPTAIYVRLHSDNALGSYSGSITHTGGGATPQHITVSGAVTEPRGPAIVATSGGSTYAGLSYSYTIATDGAQTVNSYSALNLPPELGVNGTTGLISGTPTTAGTYNVTLRATSSQGTSDRPYTLRVVGAGEQPTTPTVVINKYQNTTTDRVELLVAGDSIDGPPVDLRGMIVKDFNGSMTTDSGGKYVFTNDPLWANVKAGTLIVLASGNTLTEDLNPSDFLMRVNLANSAYFTEQSGGFDIANIDMIMIKPAGMQPDGVAGGMHALAAGTTGAQFSAFNGRKMRSNRELSAVRGYYCIVANGDRRLADFYTSNGAETATSEVFGTGNNGDNTDYIASLRALDQTAPVVTLTGSNPVNVVLGGTYTEAGATATGATGGVTTTGSVNTSVAGAYTVTYSARDSIGNVGSTTRTVNVSPSANSPPTVDSSPATLVRAVSAMLHGTVTSAGTSAVGTRGFVYGRQNSALELAAPGVSTLTAGFGTGAFSAEASGLTPGTVHYFRTFATNQTGTSYGAILSFTTLKAEPLNHAGSFAAGPINSSNIPAVWTGTEADGYLLVVGSGALTTPTDGTTAGNDPDLSDGQGAVNLPASATSYTGFTGFAPGTSYTFRLYPFNNSGSTIDYKISSAPTFTAGVLTTPELSASGSLAAFTTTYGTPSSARTFTVSGVYLSSTVDITAPAGFEVSADGVAFANPVTLTPVSGVLSPTTLYLRLTATAGVTGVYDAQTITVSGGGATTLTLATAVSGNAVAAKPLTITGLSAAGKNYNGTTAVSVVGSAVYEGLVNNESFAVSGNASWAFADKQVGSGKTLVRTGQFNAPSANYTMATQPSLTASITAKELTVAGASVTTKAYDTTTAATITDATLVGVVDGDTVTVSGGGTFNNANAGENKPVTASLTLGGAGAGNYTLSQPSLTGTIVKADQTITFVELPGKNLGDAPFSPGGTANSGLAVSYTSSNSGVASVSGSTVTILAVGTTTIAAAQTGNGNYNAAISVARTLTVTDAPSLIAGWDFQTTTNGGTAAATNNAPLLYQANFGTGSLHLDGAHGSSTWITSTNSTTNQVTAFSGTTANAATGFSTDTTTPAALALLGGASNSANGNSIVFKVDMTSRKDLSVSYATRGTASGFTTHTWSVSTNASNWTEVSAQTGRTNGTFTAITLPVITNANGASNVFLRMTATGATSSSGNNRLDNVQLMASSVAPPDTTPPVITVLGDNPLILPVGSTFIDPGATALDPTDGAVEISASGEVNTALPGTYTITYSAADAANNTTTATRIVIVVDVTAPAISLVGDSPLYLPVGATFVEPGFSAFDAIDGNLVVATSGTVDTATRGTYTLTYTATDAAGNIGTATRSVQIRSGAAHAFETQHGLVGLQAGLTADADGDGVPNLVEYAFGTDPSSGSHTPAATGLVLTGDAVRFSAVVRTNDSALVITPIATSDLRSAWNSTGITEVPASEQSDVPPGFRRRTWEIPGAPANSLFIRFGASYE